MPPQPPRSRPEGARLAAPVRHGDCISSFCLNPLPHSSQGSCDSGYGASGTFLTYGGDEGGDGGLPSHRAISMSAEEREVSFLCVSWKVQPRPALLSSPPEKCVPETEPQACGETLPLPDRPGSFFILRLGPPSACWGCSRETRLLTLSPTFLCWKSLDPLNKGEPTRPLPTHPPLTLPFSPPIHTGEKLLRNNIHN